MICISYASEWYRYGMTRGFVLYIGDKTSTLNMGEVVKLSHDLFIIRYDAALDPIFDPKFG